MTDLVFRALQFATEKHAGQVRKYTGEPYIAHPVAVADIVRRTGASAKMIAAALLHDTLEDTATTVDELETEFGFRVTDLVIELTNIYRKGQGLNRAMRKAKEQDRLALVSADAQTIKVADILHNSRCVAANDPKFAKVYLRENAALLKVLTKADPTLRQKAMEVCT